MGREEQRAKHIVFGMGTIIEDAPGGTMLVMFDKKNDKLHGSYACSQETTRVKYPDKVRRGRCYWFDNSDVESGDLKIYKRRIGKGA